ncbi:GNAT family N-acetyltransferase [Pedobacter foliorum]|uniref:GNAT family N-acetyltransferase n=1 Tax=Pedobacter foliorum TaxID=2739058 RepID=UPI00156370C3|nr:GNAT family N-acetyltransferase [Pedobacter foliorum]NRF40337.1 GNAT family N-acetyltransferase [Pedobacter foliorum]
MNIREAELKDAAAIQVLLEQLGYPTDDGFIAKRLGELSKLTDHFDIVYELNEEVLGFVSLHFIPQIAFEADYAVISFFIVDDNSRSLGIGKELEEYCTSLAVERKCKRILVHSNARRTDAHRFYLRQGFVEYPKDFVKFL